MRMTVRTNLLLPKELVDEVDRYAGPRGRSRFVAEALAERLRRERLREAVATTAGALNPDVYPHWRTADDVVAWVRERRAEQTDIGDDS
jgi:metal-responsive CopG/Arc/MetJ family transcriptional regulator